MLKLPEQQRVILFKVIIFPSWDWAN